MCIDFDNPEVKKYMFEGTFGLEKESLRVDKSGFLSHTEHPFKDNKNIDRDFCESQTEIITNVCDSADSLYNEISALQNTVTEALLKLDSGAEYLWPFSNPPYIRGEKDIPIATYTGALKGKEMYRKYLAEKYGRKKMLFSGIHFNFSFSSALLEVAFNSSGEKYFSEFKDKMYLELTKKITKYSWLIVYLTAASPVVDGSFLADSSVGQDVISEYASIRCSKAGYWNDFVPLLEYSSLDAYAKSIQSYVDSGQLISPSELYYPVRLKPSGDNSLQSLERSGVNHIELRMLDLNPLSHCGILKEDICFLHLLIVYLMSISNAEFEVPDQVSAIKNMKRAAALDEEKIKIETSSGEFKPAAAAAYEILCDMERFFGRHSYPYNTDVIGFQKRKVEDTNNRYAVIVKNRFGKNYVQAGLALADEYSKGLKREAK